MTNVPSYDALRSLDMRFLNGLLHEYGDPAWQATYEHTWQRDPATWDAILGALARLPHAEPQDTPPRWLEGLVARELRTMSTSSWAHRFHQVRLLERLGLVAPEHDDTYVLAFVGGFGRVGGGRNDGPGRAALLAEDPDLRDELLWRLFEVEGGGEVSLANIDRFFQDPWLGVFQTLVSDGTIPRERVLVSCLEALQRDFGHYRAAWFSAAYNAFGPTPEELDQHQPHLRSILLSPLPASVAFAVRHLKTLAKVGRLDGEATLPTLVSAVLVRSKGTALDVLRLAGGYAEQLRPLVVAVATTALGHENADVQRAASTLLSKLGEHGTVLTGASGLAPSVQQELGLTVTTADEETAREQQLEAVAPEVTSADLLERTSALLEGGFAAAELEAVLSGLTLHGTPELLQPLRKRAAAVAKRSSERDPQSLPGHLARILLGVLGSETPAVATQVEEQRLVLARLEEVAEAVTGRRPRRALLATPDLAGWRLSREAFLARAGASTPYPSDLVAALLRLEPADRADVITGLPAIARHPALADPPALVLTARVRTFTWNDKGSERTGSYLDWGLGLPSDGSAGEWLAVVAATRPHDAERLLAQAVRPLLDAANYPTVHHDIPVLLDTLAHHPGRMGPLATLTIAAGLVAGRGDQRLHAADAFADLVATGRIPASDVADTLGRYAGGWTLTRAADSLRHAAQAPGTGTSVVEVLTALVPQLEPGHRATGALLDVLHEQSLRLGLGVTDPALRATLASLSGSSKAARTARALLA